MDITKQTTKYLVIFLVPMLLFGCATGEEQVFFATPQLLQERSLDLAPAPDEEVQPLITVHSWDDDYSFEGTTDDGRLWVDGSLAFRFTNHPSDPVADVVCFDDLRLSSFTFWKCWARSSTALSDCAAAHAEVGAFCGNPPSSSDCATSGITDWHNLPAERLDSIGERDLGVRVYRECGGSAPNPEEDTDTYFVVDRKRTECPAQPTDFQVEGRHSALEWKDLSTRSCPAAKECDLAIAGNFETADPNYDFNTNNNPCRIPAGGVCSSTAECMTGLVCDGTCGTSALCSGSIEVLAEDNDGRPVNGSLVYVNSVFETVTDDIGFGQVSFTGVGCDDVQEVEVRCADDVTLCGVQSTEIDVVGDVDHLIFDCTACTGKEDLFIAQQDVVVDPVAKLVTVTVHSAGLSGTFNVSVRRQNAEGIIEENLSDRVTITSNGRVNATVTLESLAASDFLHIYVDDANEIVEEDEANNYVFRAAVKPVKVMLDVRSGFSVIDELITEYLGLFVDVVSSAVDADLFINVGHPREFGPFDLAEDKLVINGKRSNKPYVGVVKKEPCTGTKANISVYGNSFEGTVAGVKRLVNARSIFLTKSGVCLEEISYIDEFDPLGISVQDVLQSDEVQEYYLRNEVGFKNIIEKILFDNNFEVAVKPVKTTSGTSYGQETKLRVKNVNSDFSTAYKDTFGITETPVIFSGGIFSDLTAWEDNNGLARQMANEGWDVWEIEMTGGPFTECDDCPNYHYSDLVDHYWPASIAGIGGYTGKSSFHYVGHSNGCRAALSSLHKYSTSGKANAGSYFDFSSGQYVTASLPPRVIDRFVGVACPGTLNGPSITGSSVRRPILTLGGIPAGDKAINSLFLTNDYHLYKKDYAARANFLSWPFTLGGSKISLNLMKFYNDLYINTTTQLNFSKAEVSSLVLFAGTRSAIVLPATDNDGAVHLSDVFLINGTVQNPNATIKILKETHGRLLRDTKVHNEIKRVFK